MADIFRTFCHINEYGEQGYAELHRMLATSSPLVLWAPSSEILIESPMSSLNAEDFTKHLETGLIRVIGREEWILSRDHRNRHPWDGARWNPDVDDVIRSIALNDQEEPAQTRRVRIADVEPGERRAREHIDEHPQVVDVINAELIGPDAEANMPTGVVETARRYAHDPRTLATRVLRDAYNHVDAFAASGSHAPFLLERRESGFFQLLVTLWDVEGTARLGDTSGRPVPTDNLADLTSEVLDVLRHLETSSRATLDTFVGSAGQRMLAKWAARICTTVQEDRAANVRGKVFRTLQHDFDNGRLENRLRDLFGKREAVVNLVGTAVTVPETLQDELTAVGLLGLLTGAYGLQRDIRRRLGYVEAPYSGPQWPFLYTFGRPATGRRLRELGGIIDRLASPESAPSPATTAPAPASDRFDERRSGAEAGTDDSGRYSMDEGSTNAPESRVVDPPR